MTLRLLLILIIASCSGSKNDFSQAKDEHVFSKEDAVRLLDLLEFDPRPELPIYIVQEERLNKDVILLMVIQSKSGPKEDFLSSFKYKGHDVYLHDFIGIHNGNKNRKISFDTDSPLWKIMASFSKKDYKYFLIKSLTPSAGDSTYDWHVGQ